MAIEPRVARTGRSRGLQPRKFDIAPLRGKFAFLRGFLRNPAQVGSVIPSSPQLERRLVREARVEDARMVVELGPGTGGTTAAFLRAMPSSSRLLAIELDQDFYRHLRMSVHDARFLLGLGSAERIEDFLAASWLPSPDAVISGIPFSTMPPEVADRIAANVVRMLRPGGRFVAYQVRAHVADYLSRYLGPPKVQWEFINIPPVRVFTWVKPKRPGEARTE